MSPALYGKTITTGGGKFVEVLPTSMSATTPDVSGMLTCLSCHDGNYAQSSMMKNKVYETLPATYGNSNSIPTLLGDNGTGARKLHQRTPGGTQRQTQLRRLVRIGIAAERNGVVQMSGAHSSQFVTNYGFFVKPGSYNNTAVVVCTTCHDPHVMNVVTVTSGSTSGLPAGNLRDHVLPARALQPERLQPVVQPDGAILPSVPCRQVERDERQHRWNRVLAVQAVSLTVSTPGALRKPAAVTVPLGLCATW